MSGETLTISGLISEKYIKRNREYVRWDTMAHNTSGEVVFTASRVQCMDIVERGAPREGMGIDGGPKPERI